MDVQQLSIFDPPRARRSDPGTSQEAAARACEFTAEHYQKIITALRAGPGTIYEVAERAGITHVQVARRTSEMEGRRVRTLPGEVRRSPTGRKCRVWALI